MNLENAKVTKLGWGFTKMQKLLKIGLESTKMQKL